MITVRKSSGLQNLTLEDFEEEVRKGTILPSTEVCFPILTGDTWVLARDIELFQRLYAPARIHFARTFSLGRFPYFTLLLCLTQGVIFFSLSQGERILGLDTLIQAGAKVQPNILELGETWRLLTANFLHRDILHLVFNMFFLFNVGGTIENAYRLRDYILMLVAAAVTTTTMSVIFSDVASVGASGIVLGLFGSASVFGYKYSEILPKRYRRYFGGAVLPYALFILYVGLASRDTDNWGHLGGLLGGLLITVPLKPRLLHAHNQRRSILMRYGPLLVTLGLLAGVLTLGPMLRQVGPRFEAIEDRDSGIAFAYPWRWRFGQNHLGYPAWGNQLGASIGLRAERHGNEPANLVALKALFLREELQAKEQEGDIASVDIISERPFFIHGGKGLEMTIALESRAGKQLTRNLLITRGYFHYVVVLSAPRAWVSKYEPIFDRMVKAVRLIQTDSLRASRQLASTFPGMSSAQVALAQQLALVGEVEGAAQTYTQVLEGIPDHFDALYGLSRLTLDYGGNLRSAENTVATLLSRQPTSTDLAALLADLRQRQGRIQQACRVLQDTLDRLELPDEALRFRLRRLRCRLGVWLKEP